MWASGAHPSGCRRAPHTHPSRIRPARATRSNNLHTAKEIIADPVASTAPASCLRQPQRAIHQSGASAHTRLSVAALKPPSCSAHLHVRWDYTIPQRCVGTPAYPSAKDAAQDAAQVSKAASSPRRQHLRSAPKHRNCGTIDFWKGYRFPTQQLTHNNALSKAAIRCTRVSRLAPLQDCITHKEPVALLEPTKQSTGPASMGATVAFHTPVAPTRSRPTWYGAAPSNSSAPSHAVHHRRRRRPALRSTSTTAMLSGPIPEPLPLPRLPPTIFISSTSPQPRTASPVRQRQLCFSSATEVVDGVVGVAGAPIQDLYFAPAASPGHAVVSSRAPVEDLTMSHPRPSVDLHGPEGELVLASRLIPAVLLGALVGMERRAHRYGISVRAMTLLSVSSALITVVAAASTPAGAILASAASVRSAVMLLTCGGGVGLAAVAFIAGTLVSKKQTKSMTNTVARILRGGVSSSLIVVLVAAVGAACGAGWPLVAAACYIMSVAAVRGQWRTVGDPNGMSTRSSVDRQRRDMSMGLVEDADDSDNDGGAYVRRRGHDGPPPGFPFGFLGGGPSRNRAVVKQSSIAQRGAPLVQVGSSGGRRKQPTTGPRGRTVLRYDIDVVTGAKRVFEVYGENLDDAISKLKKHEI